MIIGFFDYVVLIFAIDEKQEELVGGGRANFQSFKSSSDGTCQGGRIGAKMFQTRTG